MRKNTNNVTTFTTTTTFAAAKAEAERAALAAEGAQVLIGMSAEYRRDGLALGTALDVEDVSVRGRLFSAWASGSAAAADALFARLISAETIGNAAATVTALSDVRFAIRGDAFNDLSDAVNPVTLAKAYVRGTLPDSDRIDAAAKVVSALSRFYNRGRYAKGSKAATRAEKAAAALEWSEAFKCECLTESERIEAERLASEAAAKAEALAKAEAELAAEAAAADAEFAAAMAAAAKAESAMAEALAKAEAAKAAALAKALAAAKAAAV